MCWRARGSGGSRRTILRGAAQCFTWNTGVPPVSVFHAERFGALGAGRLEHLPQHDEAATEAFDKGPCGFVDKWRGNERRGFGARRRSEEKNPTAEPEESLDAPQELLLHPHGPYADEVLRFVQLWACQQVLGPHGLDGGVAQTKVPHGFAQERRFPGLRLHHHQVQRRNRDLQRDGR